MNIPNPYSRPLPSKNDLGSVFTHFDPKVGKNVPTPNVLPPKKEDKEVNEDGKNSK